MLKSRGLMTGAFVANTPAALIDPASGRVVLEITGPAGKALGGAVRRFLITKPGAPSGDMLCIQLLDGEENILYECDLTLDGAAVSR